MRKFKFNVSNYVVGLALVLLLTTDSTAGKRIFSSSSRKSSSNSGRVTPSYGGGASSSSNTHGGSNSHSDVAKLSYPNYNSQPNRPASTGGQQQPPAYGWNPPKQQGPPPAYSANNPVGGSRTNMHEAPPAYHAPPSYAAPPPGATYHQPGHLPQGATYYPHAPGSYGGYGGTPAGGYHPAAGGHLPAGGTYLQPGAALPPGAVYYPQAPQSSSSGLGFGTGLLAGGLGGALLGHALTPTHTQTVQAAPAAGAADGGHDRIIIINNGQPVNVTDSGSGTTVINAAQPGQAAMPQNATDAAAPLAPMVPMPADSANGTMPAPAEPRIICVPVRVNETDPNDSSKMIEIEKIACYPEPPQPAQQQQQQPDNNQNVPLAPMQPIETAQQHPQDAAVRQVTSSAETLTDKSSLALVGSVLLALYYSCRMH